MLRFAVCHRRQVRLHHLPDFVGDGDTVAVQVHAEGGDDVGLGTEADRRAQRLSRQHVSAVEFAGDDPVQQHLPVGLRFEGDEQALILEEVLFVGDRQRRHIGELDEAELDLFLFQGERLRCSRQWPEEGGGDGSGAPDDERFVAAGPGKIQAAYIRSASSRALLSIAAARARARLSLALAPTAIRPIKNAARSRLIGSDSGVASRASLGRSVAAALVPSL